MYFFLIVRRPPRSPLFPCTTLFRSVRGLREVRGCNARPGDLATARHELDPPRLRQRARRAGREAGRSEEHTSELQPRQYLVCRLLLEKKNNTPSCSSSSVCRLLPVS